MAACSKEDVSAFIDSFKAKIMLNSIEYLIIPPRGDHKNQNCMVELGLRHRDVANILLKLEIQHYSHTADDYRYPGKKLRVFGYNYLGEMLYIKIAIRKKVFLVSFHPDEYGNLRNPNEYPYR